MQLFNRWSRIRLAMICDGALLRESGATIFVDARKRFLSTLENKKNLIFCITASRRHLSVTESVVLPP
ncbi:MAG TPA: hypothetical protein VK577_16915 [Bradyrhizobium sp.]|jgi:hypothetical protein|nr:hypothetical protein [Bradyrhizobium sp.]